jgi:hypothetical protein
MTATRFFDDCISFYLYLSFTSRLTTLPTPLIAILSIVHKVP